MIFAKNIAKNYSLCEKCSNSEFFLVFSCIRTEYGEIIRIWTLSMQWLCKSPLSGNSEPRVILFSSWNSAYLSLDAVVLQFLKNSSSVFFKGFQTVSNLSFLQFRISCFLERPLSGSIFDRFDLCCLLLYVVCFTCGQFQKK